jgi:hypothetical protein
MSGKGSMKTTCPVCKAPYGLVDRLTQSDMCGPCFSAGAVVPNDASPAIVQGEKEDDFESPGLAKFAIRMGVRLCGGVLFVGLLLIGVALDESGSPAGDVLTAIAVCGFFYTAIVSFILPGLIVEDKMSPGAALGLVTLWTPTRFALESLVSAYRRRCRRPYRNPFLDE